jgi:hypothetical protein
MTVAGRFHTAVARHWLPGFLTDLGDGVWLVASLLIAVEFTRSPAAVAAVTAVQSLRSTP